MTSLLDSSIGVATGYELDGPASIPGSVQTRSGAHPASYPVGTGGIPPWGYSGEAWSWPFASTPPYVFMA
jgi:hypothetical protein